MWMVLLLLSREEAQVRRPLDASDNEGGLHNNLYPRR